MTRFPRLLVALVPFLLAACGESLPEADPATRRTIAQGEIVGASIDDGAVLAWKGIPFAAPPTGDLRWRAPRPPASWEGVRETLASGGVCTQLGGDPLQGSEDCLYLDVFAPAAVAEEGADLLPVMYWIHGGGNTLGSGDMMPPQALARDNGVVLVTINYRLGLFGWLSHDALRAGASGPEDASGNFGTLDIIRGLEWVQENIAQFGGDPGRVTIFGESAGGLNVFSMLVSPIAKDLFHAAIAQSGSPTTMTRDESDHYTDDAEAPGLPGSSGELLIALLQQAGRAEDRASAKAVAAEMELGEIEAFLRGHSAAELLQPFVDEVGDASMPMYIVPNIFQDGHVVRRGEPIDLFATPGAYNAVPFIAGTNREESKLFVAFDSPHVERTFGLPSGFSNLRMYDVEGEYGGLVWRAMGADEPLAAMRKSQGPTVWGYRFDWDEEPVVLGTDLSKLLGAAHAMELFFVFGLTDLGFANRFIFEDPESATLLSERMRSYWANFAYTYRPGRGQGGDLPDWAPWGDGSKDPKYIVFDTDAGDGLRMERDQIDQAWVVSRAMTDPRMLSDEERCRVYKNMVQWSEALTPEAYTTIGEGMCEPFPIGSRLDFPSLSHDPAE
ncbi:MAG: carboxylesterase family protein [bacterium]|nr:carboxylesterase family protein [bacterium]